VIAADWRIAQLVLQILAEQGPGMAIARVEAEESAQLMALGRSFRRA